MVSRNSVRTRPRVAPAATRHAGRPRVVAEILSDGTVRRSGEAGLSGTARRRWASGTVAGDGWTLWWERRAWDSPPAGASPVP